MKSHGNQILLFLVIVIGTSEMRGQSQQLDIQGAITLDNSNSGTPALGTIHWNGRDFQGYNGFNWISLTGYDYEIPTPYYGSVTDIDGNHYWTIKIGNQEWMASNLRTTRYRNGTFINNIIEKHTWVYNSDPAYEPIVGRLYDWEAVTYSLFINSDALLCPTGWHIPDTTEWNELVNFLGGKEIAGNKLKEAGKIHWRTNNGATNESGFTALPGGVYGIEDFDGLIFGLKAIEGYWWSKTTAINLSQAYCFNLSSISTFGSLEILPKYWGTSIRCIKD